MNKILKIAIPTILSFPLLFYSSNMVVASEPPTHTITVNGIAHETIQPSKARVSFGIIGEGVSAPQAKKELDRHMNQVLDALYQLPIKETNLQTTNFSISPLYTESNVNEVAKIKGYRTRNLLTLETDDLNLLAEIISAAIDAGANTVQNVDFLIDVPDELHDKLLANAVRNGQHQAALIANTAGVELGRLISADTEIHTAIYGQNKMYAMDSRSTPLFAGSEKISLEIHLVYEIL